MSESHTITVTFLGTGTSTGIPMIGCGCAVCRSEDPRDKRTRCSVYVRSGETGIVIDTGPDFREQMLRERIDDLDAVLFTHAHKDHIAGLDDIRPVNYLKQKVIDVYANAHTAGRLKQEYPYIFEGDYPGVPLIRLKEIVPEPFEVQGVPVQPIRAMHGSMEVYGFRIGGFTYLTDANYINEEELEKIRGSSVFVINALHRREHYSHFTLDEALDVIKQVGAERSYLIHMSHFMGKHADVDPTLPEGVHLSYDGLKITVEDRA